MRTLRAAAGLVGLLAVETAAVVGLHRLGAMPWLQVPLDQLPTWLVASSPEDAVVAVLRLVALGCAYWLLASTCLYTLALLSGVPAALRAVRWATPGTIRRLAERALGVALAVGALGGATPAALAASPATPAPVETLSGDDLLAPPAAPLPAYVPTPAGDAPAAPPVPLPPAPPWGPPPPPLQPSRSGPQPVQQAPAQPPPPPPQAARPDPPPAQQPAVQQAPVPPPAPATATPRLFAPPPPAATVRPPPAAERARTHLVVAGDNLWNIAARDLALGTHRSVADLSAGEVHAYWRELVAANRATLRSGDPDLIYPGEQVVLPRDDI